MRAAYLLSPSFITQERMGASKAALVLMASPEQIFKNHFLSQVYASFVTKLEENQALLGVVKRLPMLPSKTSALAFFLKL